MAVITATVKTNKAIVHSSRDQDEVKQVLCEIQSFTEYLNEEHRNLQPVAKAINEEVNCILEKAAAHEVPPIAVKWALIPLQRAMMLHAITVDYRMEQGEDMEEAKGADKNLNKALHDLIEEEGYRPLGDAPTFQQVMVGDKLRWEATAYNMRGMNSASLKESLAEGTGIHASKIQINWPFKKEEKRIIETV